MARPFVLLLLMGPAIAAIRVKTAEVLRRRRDELAPRWDSIGEFPRIVPFSQPTVTYHTQSRSAFHFELIAW
jgi:hypothetical protein